MKTRELRPHEEMEILDWCHTNPKCNLDAKIMEWRQKFNCSEFEIMKLFVKNQLIKIKQNKQT